jgi:hypothetical protein
MRLFRIRQRFLRQGQRASETLSSMILVVWALMLCANAGVMAQALAAGASPSRAPAAIPLVLTIS